MDGSKIEHHEIIPEALTLELANFSKSELLVESIKTFRVFHPFWTRAQDDIANAALSKDLERLLQQFGAEPTTPEFPVDDDPINPCHRSIEGCQEIPSADVVFASELICDRGWRAGYTLHVASLRSECKIIY